MNRSIILFLFGAIFLFMACEPEENVVPLDDQLTEAIEAASKTGSIDYFRLPHETEYDKLPNQDPDNAITEAKVFLGKFLFFETGLAQKALYEECMETYSCSSCHIPSKGFLPGRLQGIADGGIGYGEAGEIRNVSTSYHSSDLDAQGTRPLTTMNSTYITNTLWSGLFGADGVNVGTENNWVGLAEVNHTGYTGLEAQNIEAFDLHRLDINDKVLDEYGYRKFYDLAFPDFSVEERYTPTTSSFAISAFLRTILTNRAPFQDWLRGDEGALTEAQKKGAITFFGKAKCLNCHNGPSFSSMNFHAMGTRDMWEFGGLNTDVDDARNLGRALFTSNTNDSRRFKVPQLYNLKDYVTYFHGSSKTSLRDVLEFKINAKSENDFVSDSELSPLFQPLNLTDEEIEDLLEFLTNALHDPDMERYMPDVLPSGNCFPNNDPQSISDLGCGE